MPRFFVQASSIEDGVVRLFGSDASHISRSLRMRPGEEIVVCDMQRREYRCVLERFTADEVYARVISESASETEPPYRITVYQALAKSDKMDYIVQKSVEAGAFAVVPFEGERCVARELSDNGTERARKRLERRNRIALEAAKQCGRGIVPSVSEPVSFDAMLDMASRSAVRLFFYEGDGTVSLREYLTREFSAPGETRGVLPEGSEISVVIGAEGGFSSGEVDMAREKGFVLCGLGKRILRCETASAFALACLAFWFEI